MGEATLRSLHLYKANVPSACWPAQPMLDPRHWSPLQPPKRPCRLYLRHEARGPEQTLVCMCRTIHP